MSAAENFLLIPCAGDRMLGVLHGSEKPARLGVLIVVGGPQYRVGSHRQFVVLARALAEDGIPVLRFDCRGMGDSEGRFRSFEHIGDDIRAAVDAFFAHQPGLAGVVLWGLCDSASAGMFYGGTDPRIVGMILANPWARTEAGFARAHLRHYYVERLLSAGFWRNVVTGKYRVGASLASFAGMVRKAVRPAEPKVEASAPVADEDRVSLAELGLGDAGLPDRMRTGLDAFRGPVLFLMSGNDLTAREFDGTWKASRRWRRTMGRPGCMVQPLPPADHTWSNRADLDAALKTMRDWIARLATVGGK